MRVCIPVPALPTQLWGAREAASRESEEGIGHGELKTARLMQGALFLRTRSFLVKITWGGERNPLDS